MFKIKLLFAGFVILLFVLFFSFDLHQYLNPDIFISKKKEIDSLYQSSPLLFILAFFLFYVFCATLNIPGAALLSLISGFLFDFLIGSLVVSLGSTTGATLSFFLSRFLLKDFIQKRFHSRLQKINRGIEKDGAFYLFSLRLVPLFPFFLINVLMGLTPISTKQFVIASFLGMLPSSLVYVNAGNQLTEVKSLTDIFSLPLICSFLFLALLPWIMKFLLKNLPLNFFVKKLKMNSSKSNQ